MNRVELINKRDRLAKRYATLKLTSNNINESLHKAKIANKLYWEMWKVSKALKRIDK